LGERKRPRWMGTAVQSRLGWARSRWFLPEAWYANGIRVVERAHTCVTSTPVRAHRGGSNEHTARRVSVKGISSFVHLYLPLSLFFLLVFPCTLIFCTSSTGSLFPLLYRTSSPAPQNRFLTFCVHETRPSENATVLLFRTWGHIM